MRRKALSRPAKRFPSIERKLAEALRVLWNGRLGGLTKFGSVRPGIVDQARN